jgi:hypothetical protein
MFRFRAQDAKSIVAVQRSKSQQSASRVYTPRSSHACRSCYNDFKIVMANALKLLQQKLLLMPPQLLL